MLLNKNTNAFDLIESPTLEFIQLQKKLKCHNLDYPWRKRYVGEIDLHSQLISCREPSTYNIEFLNKTNNDFDDLISSKLQLPKVWGYVFTRTDCFEAKPTVHVYKGYSAIEHVMRSNEEIPVSFDILVVDDVEDLQDHIINGKWLSVHGRGNKKLKVSRRQKFKISKISNQTKKSKI